MGSCFSKRKKSDAALIHSISPRSSFGINCKDSTTAVPSAAVSNPREEMVVVLSKPASSAGSKLTNNSNNSCSVPVVQLSKMNKPGFEQGMISPSSSVLGDRVSAQQANMQQGIRVSSDQKIMISSEQKTIPEQRSILLSEHKSMYFYENNSITSSEKKNISSEQKDMISSQQTSSVFTEQGCKSPNDTVSLERIGKFLCEQNTSKCKEEILTPIDEQENRNPDAQIEITFPALKREPPLQSINEEFAKLGTQNNKFHVSQNKKTEATQMVRPEEVTLFNEEDELVIGDSKETEITTHANSTLPQRPLSLSNLKRCRSCEEPSHPEDERPLRRRSFQDDDCFRTNLETISERRCDEDDDDNDHPSSGVTAFLEGLNLAPSRNAHKESSSVTSLDIVRHDSTDLSAEFFELKSRYLSTRSSIDSGTSVSRLGLGHLATTGKDDAGSFSLLHSSGSSEDSTPEVQGVANFLNSQKDSENGLYFCHPTISFMDEDSESDESDMFEFTKAVSVSSQSDILSAEQPRRSLSLDAGDAKKGEDSFDMPLNELAVVATGDAVLCQGTNAEEIDLIPSRSYARSSSAKAVLVSSGGGYENSMPKVGRNQEQDQNQSKAMTKDTMSLSVEEIISLLEKDELDEEILVSFLNTGGKSMSGTNTPLCPQSDAASEASFEFKLISTGSTPHSTPSTPMLSAGSTPKRISQISPLALSPEEIAEIWGVFEQRQQQQQQAYSLYQQQHHIY